MQELDVQLPPRAVDAEQAILCAILEQPDLMTHAADLLLPEHFYSNAHQQIYRACQECFSQQVPINLPSLLQVLAVAGALESSGGKAYLHDLLIGANQNVSVLNADSLRYWAKVVIDAARRREVISTCWDIQESAYDVSDKTYLESAQDYFFYITEAFPDGQQTTTTSQIDEALASIVQEANSPNRVTGLSTGWRRFDRVTHGLQPWQLITISARPGGGKSAAALNISAHVATQLRRPVLYFSLEMKASELMKRLIRATAGVTEDLQRHAEAAEYLRMHQHRLIIEDTAGLTIAAIQAKILKVKKQHPDIGLVVVDHIGLITPDASNKRQNKAYEIQDITTRLKTLAKTIEAPIIQLAQMNRGIEGRQEKKPQLSDLRDSGSIEQDSDMVIFTEIERGEDRKPTGKASLIIAKQRDGVLEEIPMQFVAPITLFKDTLF